MTCKHKWKWAQQIWEGTGPFKGRATVARWCGRCKSLEVAGVGRYVRATKLNTRRGMVNSVLSELVPAWRSLA